MTTTTAEALATRDEYAGAIATALGAAAAYYGSGDSALDDASFDLLMGLIQAYEERYPEHTDAASPTGKVAGGAVPAGDVAHTAAMLSLANAFSPQDLLDWEASLVRRLGAPVAGGYVSSRSSTGPPWPPGTAAAASSSSSPGATGPAARTCRTPSAPSWASPGSSPWTPPSRCAARCC